MRTSSNPVLNKKSFEKIEKSLSSSQVMTVKGTIQKTFLMALLVLASALWSWSNPSTTWMIVGLVGGIITALITIFKPHFAPLSAPMYAVFEGLFLGGISLVISGFVGSTGIVIQAISLTIGVLFLMLFLYSAQIIKVTEKLKMGVFAATGAIGLMYLINFIMSFFGASFMSLGDNSMMAIGINLLIVGVAAFNLLLDFDFIEKSAASHAPKEMEWYGAFGLMVTLIWLYIELLQLLSRLNRN